MNANILERVQQICIIPATCLSVLFNQTCDGSKNNRRLGMACVSVRDLATLLYDSVGIVTYFD